MFKFICSVLLYCLLDQINLYIITSLIIRYLHFGKGMRDKQCIVFAHQKPGSSSNAPNKLGKNIYSQNPLMVDYKVEESSQKVLISHPSGDIPFHNYKIFLIDLISVSFSYSFCFSLKVFGFFVTRAFS